MWNLFWAVWRPAWDLRRVSGNNWTPEHYPSSPCCALGCNGVPGKGCWAHSPPKNWRPSMAVGALRDPNIGRSPDAPRPPRGQTDVPCVPLASACWTSPGSKQSCTANRDRQCPRPAQHGLQVRRHPPRWRRAGDASSITSLSFGGGAALQVARRFSPSAAVYCPASTAATFRLSRAAGPPGPRPRRANSSHSRPCPVHHSLRQHGRWRNISPPLQSS
mmetsp:Transcript_47020/g.131018  ORF Transcript_47020/g.131018 Transcript_47020/m.131018 type:complete len:218 (+) Transcript_47020:923-1576(+)